LLRPPREPVPDARQELVRRDLLAAEVDLAAVGARDQQQVAGELDEPVGLLARRGHRPPELLLALGVVVRQVELGTEERERGPPRLLRRAPARFSRVVRNTRRRRRRPRVTGTARSRAGSSRPGTRGRSKKSSRCRAVPRSRAERSGLESGEEASMTRSRPSTSCAKLSPRSTSLLLAAAASEPFRSRTSAPRSCARRRRSWSSDRARSAPSRS